jgi:hypothetical protein
MGNFDLKNNHNLAFKKIVFFPPLKGQNSPCGVV